jgi:hypothetical protein
VDSNGRIVDLGDDPMLGEAGPSGSSTGREELHPSTLRPEAANSRPSSSKSKSSEHRRPVGADYPGDRRSGDKR